MFLYVLRFSGKTIITHDDYAENAMPSLLTNQMTEIFKWGK